jgi:hypothetical protein
MPSFLFMCCEYRTKELCPRGLHIILGKKWLSRFHPLTVLCSPCNLSREPFSSAQSFSMHNQYVNLNANGSKYIKGIIEVNQNPSLVDLPDFSNRSQQNPQYHVCTYMHLDTQCSPTPPLLPPHPKPDSPSAETPSYLPA